MNRIFSDPEIAGLMKVLDLQKTDENLLYRIDEFVYNTDMKPLYKIANANVQTLDGNIVIGRIINEHIIFNTVNEKSSKRMLIQL